MPFAKFSAHKKKQTFMVCLNAYTYTEKVGFEPTQRLPALAHFECAPLDHLGTSPKALERVRGIEPPPSAWEAGILPLNYTRGKMTNKRKKGYKPFFQLE